MNLDCCRVELLLTALCEWFAELVDPVELVELVESVELVLFVRPVVQAGQAWLAA